MRYWFFHNNQVNGPYEPEALVGLPNYGAESLVCPETSSGTSMGDWQRAGMVPDLSGSLMKTPSLASQGKLHGVLYENLPPEPTLHDLAAVHDVQEKLSVLEKNVLQLEEEMRLKDSELVGLRQELKDKNSRVMELGVKLEGLSSELSAKVGGLEDKIAPLPALRENLEQASSAQKNLESTLQAQRQSLAEMNLELERVKNSVGEIGGLKDKIQEIAKLKDEMHQIETRLAQPKVASAPEMEFPSRPSPMAVPISPPSPPPPPQPSAYPPLAEPAAELIPPSPMPQPFYQPTMPTVPDVPATVSFQAPPPVARPPILPPAASAKIPPVAVKQVSQSKSKLPLILLVLSMAGGGVYLSGVLTPQKKIQEEAPPMPGPTTMPEPTALASQTQETQDQQLKNAALTLLKSWTIPSGQSLGSHLETGPLPVGGLSPWMVEKISDDMFQVNFYAPPSSTQPQRTTYEFEVRLNDKKVSARNEAALALLQAPPAPAPPTPRMLRRGERKGKKRLTRTPGPAALAAPGKAASADDKVLNDLLDSKEKDKEEKPVADKSLDELLLPGIKQKQTPSRETENAEPAPEPSAAPATQRKGAREKPKSSAKQPDDAALLDDLLKP